MEAEIEQLRKDIEALTTERGQPGADTSKLDKEIKQKRDRFSKLSAKVPVPEARIVSLSSRIQEMSLGTDYKAFEEGAEEPIRRAQQPISDTIRISTPDVASYRQVSEFERNLSSYFEKESITVLRDALCLFYANCTTSNKLAHDLHFSIKGKKITHGQVLSFVPVGTTIRQLMRRYADYTRDLLVQGDVKTRIALSLNPPPNFSALCFDYATHCTNLTVNELQFVTSAAFIRLQQQRDKEPTQEWGASALAERVSSVE